MISFPCLQEMAFKLCVPLDFIQAMIVYTGLYRINFMLSYDCMWFKKI